jgi:hypothetical protein
MDWQVKKEGNAFIESKENKNIKLRKERKEEDRGRTRRVLLSSNHSCYKGHSSRQ